MTVVVEEAVAVEVEEAAAHSSSIDDEGACPPCASACLPVRRSGPRPRPPPAEPPFGDEQQFKEDDIPF